MNNKTQIIFIMDRSSSMSRHTDTVKTGIHNFIADQQELDVPAEISFVYFDSHVLDPIDYELDEIGTHQLSRIKNTFYPQGSTALLDAIGKATEHTFHKVSTLIENGEPPSSVILIVVTDGGENVSSQFSESDIRDMVTELEADFDWDYLFIGSNQDAYVVGQRYGIKAGKALSFANSEEGFVHAFEAISRTVKAYRQSGAPRANQFFTEEDHEFQREAGAAAAPMYDETLL